MVDLTSIAWHTHTSSNHCHPNTHRSPDKIDLGLGIPVIHKSQQPQSDQQIRYHNNLTWHGLNLKLSPSESHKLPLSSP